MEKETKLNDYNFNSYENRVIAYKYLETDLRCRRDYFYYYFNNDLFRAINKLYDECVGQRDNPKSKFTAKEMTLLIYYTLGMPIAQIIIKKYLDEEWKRMPSLCKVKKYPRIDDNHNIIFPKDSEFYDDSACNVVDVNGNNDNIAKQN